MGSETMQQQVGDALIESLKDRAREGLRSSSQLEEEEFAHIDNLRHRQDLARVYYGASWQYRLGLLLMATEEERATHVRAQIIDYASVVEGLLSDAVAHAIRHGFAVGDSWLFCDPSAHKKRINWKVQSIDNQVGRQSFCWLVDVSAQFGIVSLGLVPRLHDMRRERNTVHLRQHSAIGKIAYTNQSKKAFETATECIAATKAWKNARPEPRARWRP